MLTERAASYVLHQHLSSGKSLEDLSAKWNRTYPDDAIAVAEAEGFLTEVQRLRDSGVKATDSVELARLGQKPKLTVSTAKKAKKVKKVKK